MNRIYRLVWNRAKRVMQVASELAASGTHGGATGTGARYRPRHALALACALALPGVSAWAATLTVDTTQPFYDQSSAALLQSPVVFEGGTFKPTTGFTLSTPITLDTPGGFIDATNGNVYLSGTVSGPGGLTIAGGGVALTTANTYSGGTTINSGAVLGIQLTLAALPGNVVDNGFLQLEATTGTYAGTISGLGGVQVVSLGGGTLVLTGNNTAAGPLYIYDSTVRLGAGGTTGSWGGNGISVASSLVFDRSDTLTYGGLISDFNGGSGSLTQAGTGTLILTDNNTYTGGTTINAGTLQLGNGGTTGSISGNVVDNGTLAFDRSGTLTVSGVISGTGSVQQVGSGTTSLTNANNYTGGTTISAGTLQVTDASSLGTGTITIGNASLTSTSFFSTNSAIGFNGNATISAADNLDLSGAAVSGSGNLTTNSSTFSAGDATINGSLSVTTTAGGITQTAGVFGVSGASSFNAGANAIALTSAGNAFTGAVGLTGGNVSLTNSTATTLDTSTASGTLSVSSGGALTQSGVITAGTLTGSSQGSTTLTDANQISTLGAFNAGGNFSLINASALVISGTLSAANVAINDSAGIVVTGAINASGSTTIGNGTSLQIGSGSTTGSIAGNVVDNGTLAFNHSDTVNFAGDISGTGSLTKSGSGTLVIAGLNLYTGGTTINGGTLQIGNGGVAGSIAGDVLDNGTLAFDAGANYSFAGVLSGTGKLAQIGGFTLTLDGNSSGFAGSTEVTSGKLIVGSIAGNGAALGGNVSVDSGATLGGHGTIGGNVDVASGAHLTPGGSIGTLTIGGNASFAQGSVLDYEFGAAGANFTTFGTGDSVKVGGNLELDGATLNVSDVGGFGPGLYNLFTYGGSLTETSGGIALGTTPAGDTLVIQNLAAAKQINLLNTTGMTLNFWNGNNLASATQMGGGNGIWTTTSPNWTDATGSVSAPMQPQPGFAIFGGATAGTVTVDNSAGNVSATGLQFASNGYSLTGGMLTLVGSGAAPIIRVGDGSAASATYTATINNVIAGTSGLAKSDLGTLVLTGANTYNGGTTINGGTLEVANNSALGTDSVTVDNTGSQGATLKVDSGITLTNTIAINNSGTLDNAGTISHTNASDIGVNATGGMATVTNHDGGSIAGGVIGLWLHTGGTVTNTGNTSSISGINYALVTDGSPSTVTNQLGASIHSSATDAVLMIRGGTLTNDSGANISGNVGVRMSQVGTVINQGGASINGTTNGNGTGVGVVLHQGGNVTNQGGASITGTGTGIALAGNSTVVNTAGSHISGPDASVMVFGSGAVNLTNAGVLSGNVLLGAGDVNSVTLISGSTLTGSLYIGSNNRSQLTLDGTGTQLYSTAVTGSTSFAGTLTKQGSGSWIVDSDLAPANTVISAGILQLGNGGSTGSLAGNITDNAALVSDLSSAVTLAGVISGTGSLTQNGIGVLTLTGANSYTGGTRINTGTLQLGNGGTSGSISGNVIDNGTLAFDHSDNVNFGGVISGSGALTQNGNGTLTLTSANSYTGGTTISAGKLQLGNGGTTGSISGNVIDNGTLAFDHSDAVAFAGAISGSGMLAQSGGGTLTLSGADSYSGGTVINAGTLQGDSTSLQGNIADNGTLVFNQNTAGTFAGVVFGSGTLTKTGRSLLTMNGHNTFAGTTTVQAGTLEVGDAGTPTAFLGGNVQVGTSGTLRGHGTIGGNVVNGGSVWPGGSIGTLTVQGNYTQNANSVMNIDALPTGQASLLAVGGTVSLLGGSAMVLAQAGNWAPRTDYTIITAAGGVSGQFASASSSLTFLNPVLSYTANAVNLSLQRNDIRFASVAQTPNQRATATAADDLGWNSPTYAALATLDTATARYSFDQLSGVIHANTTTALVDDSRYVREAINRHLLGLNDGAEGATAEGISAWTSAWGHGGRHDDDGNAGLLQANGSGLLVGADLPLGNSRLGAVVGHGQNSIHTNSLGSSAHVLGDHVGLYGSSTFGAFVLRAGAAYAWQDVHTTRALAFGSYSDYLSSTHHARTAHAYVEGGYQFSVSPGQQLEPFVNVARVQVHNDAIQEAGGNAAVAVAANSTAVNTATVGLRDTLSLDATGGFHAHASVGYQQAWGDLKPLDSMRFASGRDSFAIAGSPVARQALTTDLGVDFKLAKNVTTDISYFGQFASGVQDQGARMSLVITF